MSAHPAEPLWDELHAIALAWGETIQDAEVGGFRAAAASTAEVRDALNAGYALQTQLRRLKQRVRVGMVAQRETSLGQGGASLTRERLTEYQRAMGRWAALLDDLEHLFESMETAIRRLERHLGSATYIYALSDPDTGEVRYVGKADDPRRRLGEHLNSPTNEDMAAWLEALASQGKQPDLEVLEVVTDGDWAQKEARHIWRMRRMGFNLLNRDGPS